MQLSEIWSEFKKEGIGLVAISVDTREESSQLATDKKITVPLLSDPEMEIISAYGVAMEGKDIAVPATFIITADKKIHWKYIGENMTDRPDGNELLRLAMQAR